MGMIHHHAVIATTWDDKRFKAVLEWMAAEELTARFVSGPAVINGYE